jgi:hypothetical protein
MIPQKLILENKNPPLDAEGFQETIGGGVMPFAL